MSESALFIFGCRRTCIFATALRSRRSLMQSAIFPVSVPMDKYVITEITPYLVIDAEHVPNPRPLDDEEDIEIVRGVTAEEILRMIREGDFNLVGGWGALLALEKLRELGEI